jgi:hypothetical protein
MLLSLTETKVRQLKRKKDLVDNGIIQGVALQARGFIVSRYGEGALLENKVFFGNMTEESKKKNLPETQSLLEQYCAQTWTYGE